MHINRKQILQSFLDNIADIANRAYQEKIWIRGEGPECDDFDETVCFFFEDIDPILKDYKIYNISDSQYQLLKKFRDEFDEFAEQNFLPQVFIDTPEWLQIMEMAKEILEAFSYEKDKNN